MVSMINVNKNLRPGNLNLAIQNAIVAATIAAIATVTVETKILLIKLFPNFFGAEYTENFPR